MPVINNRSTTTKTGGLTGRVSSPRNLRSTHKANKVVPGLDYFIIEADEYEYPVEERVPSGYYFSEIKKLEARIKNDKVVLDASYEICPTLGSDVYHIKQTYPEGSKPLRDFYKAMVKAGVKPGPNLKDAIGIREIIVLSYVSEKSDFGSIVRRKPDLTTTGSQNDDPEEETEEDDDEDSEFGDLLSAFDEE